MTHGAEKMSLVDRRDERCDLKTLRWFQARLAPIRRTTFESRAGPLPETREDSAMVSISRLVLCATLVVAVGARAVEAEEPALLQENEITRLREVIKEHDEAVERKRDKEDKHRAYLENWFPSFWLGSLTLSADANYTNVDEWKNGPGLQPGTATELDGDNFLYGTQVSWDAKPLLRDVFLLSDRMGMKPRERRAKAAEEEKTVADRSRSEDNECRYDPDEKFPRRALYRCWKEKRAFIRWGVLDAFRVSGGARYGSVVDDPSGSENSTTSQRGSYFVGVSYKIPLENFGDPFIE